MQPIQLVSTIGTEHFNGLAMKVRRSVSLVDAYTLMDRRAESIREETRTTMGEQLCVHEFVVSRYHSCSAYKRKKDSALRLYPTPHHTTNAQINSVDFPLQGGQTICPGTKQLNMQVARRGDQS